VCGLRQANLWNHAKPCCMLMPPDRDTPLIGRTGTRYFGSECQEGLFNEMDDEARGNNAFGRNGTVGSSFCLLV